jgi:hypothetical protein
MRLLSKSFDRINIAQRQKFAHIQGSRGTVSAKIEEMCSRESESLPTPTAQVESIV